MWNHFIGKAGGPGALLLVCALAAVALGSHRAEGQAQPSAPASLKPPTGERLRAHAHASGKRFYTCDGSKWTLSGPDAKLFDEAGQVVGYSLRRAKLAMVGRSRSNREPIANATPDPESIPWLLLIATGHTGDGVMKNVSSIQRLQTKGGKAPLPDGLRRIAQRRAARISYTAEYYFYVQQ